MRWVLLPWLLLGCKEKKSAPAPSATPAAPSATPATSASAPAPDPYSDAVAAGTPAPAEPTEPLTAGYQAPDFLVPAHDGTKVSLAGLRGGPVVLYFYPADDTPG